MFSSCCCVSKKALKKAKDEQTKVSEKESELGDEIDGVEDTTIKPPKCDNNNSLKSPQSLEEAAATATDAGKVSEKGQNGGEDGYNTNNDKSNSSEEDSAILSGLIMSDGLVEEIDIQLKNRLVRKKSTDTTSGGSNVTVIEGVVQDEIVEAAKNTSGSDISDTVSAKNSSIEISKEIGVVFNYEPIQESPIEPKHLEVYSEPEINSEQEVESITQEEFNPPEIELESDVSEIVKEIVLENIEKFTTNEVIQGLSSEPAATEEEIFPEVEVIQPEFLEEIIPDPIVEFKNGDQIDLEDFPKEIPEPIVEEVVEVLKEIIPESLIDEIIEEEVVEEISEVIVEEISVVEEEISVVEETPEPIEEFIPEPLIEETLEVVEVQTHVVAEEEIQEAVEEKTPEIVEEEIPEPIIEETPEPVIVKILEMEVENIAKLIIDEIQEILIKKETPEPDQKSNEQKTDLEKSIEILEEDLNKPLPSCLSRRNSSRLSIKKKVNYTETTEVIPEQVYFMNEDDLHHESPKDDDDDVFSDSIEPILPRGNMCTPYIPKRGSVPGLEALPDWFPNSENGGQGQNGWSEPPTTPIGKDELALKRHRYFTNLLDAAQAAIDQRVCSNPMGPMIADILNPPQHVPTTNTCQAESNQPAAADLCNLLGRLETIVTRLERSVSERDLDPELITSITSITSSTPTVACAYSQTDLTELKEDDKNLPTVLPHIEQRLERLHQEQKQQQQQKTLKQEFFAVLEDNHEKKMSVAAYEDIISGSLAQFLELSGKIGDDVATQAEYVKKAFDAQLKYVTLASQSSAPDQSEVPKMLSATSEQITAIITFREKHRTSKLFNHLSAISESIPALGWVCVSPTPGPHVKEMNDAGQFYTNRVLKEWKEKDVKHCNWAKAWVQTLTELQQYIKQYHTTGIVWSGKTKASAGALNGNSGSAAPPPPPPNNLPPPPPMPAFDPSLNAPAGDDDRNALFAQINQGADITKKLKKVTSDMQTHKNTALREGPAPYKGPTPFKKAPETAPKVVAPIEKEPVFSRDGKKWLIEYQKNNPNLLVENVEMNNVVYMFKSQNSTLTVKGKLNSIVIDSCKKCSIVFDSLVSSVEFVNCQSVQMQVLGYVPTISIDKTDGCQMFLSKESFNVEIVSSKSSEMNVMLPNAAGDDYTEQAIPEQFKTKIAGNSLKTECVESLG